jgi:TonB family protein
MNPPPAEPQMFAESRPPDEGWSWRRWLFFLLVAVAVHFILVYLFGAKKNIPPRAVVNAPQFHLLDESRTEIALTDPTLFAQPHDDLDFMPAEWQRPPQVPPPVFFWTEPVPFLPVADNSLGAAFNVFLETNRFSALPLNFKPDPQFTVPAFAIESALPRYSTAQTVGALADRHWLNPPEVPTIACNDILAPSRVQVLVDGGGNVVSAVLLESSEWDEADQQALTLARAARFNPSADAILGEIIFNWHTVPTNAP